MYSTHNNGKSVAAERFVRILKNKISYMTFISKNMYIDKLDNIINKYNNTYHRTIKQKSVDVKSSIYIDFSKENNKQGSKFKVGDHVRILEYKNIFAKDFVPNWTSFSKSLLKKLKLVCHGTFVSDLNCGELVGTLYEKRIVKNKSRIV